MAQDTKAIVELVQKGHSGINYLAGVSGDRHILDVPIGLIEKHPMFLQIRGKDPSDLSILSSSMKETEGPVYMPCLYAELAGGNLKLFVADGHQRLASAKANGDEAIVCQYLSRWDTAEKAFSECVGVQFAHFHPSEEDVLSILRSGKLTQAQVASKTGLSESKVSRLAKVADETLEWLYQAVKDGLLSLGVAGKLVDACNKQPDKLAALECTFSRKRAEAEEKRLFWENDMKARKRKWDKKTKDKAKITTYFKNVNWNVWTDALEADSGIVTVDNVHSLKVDDTSSPTKSGVRIGDVSDWKNEFAIYGFFEKPIDAVDPQDVGYILAHWDEIREMLVAIQESKTIPSLNPIVPVTPPSAPTPQQPRMTVDRTTATDEADEDDSDS